MKRLIRLGTLVVSLVWAGCIMDGNSTDPEQGPKLFIAESDYTAGLLQWIFLENQKLGADSLSISSDPALRAHNGSLYVLERFGADNILKFDPTKSDESGVIYQKHLEDNSNPVDIEFAGANKAYVSLQNTGYLLIVNPATGDPLGRIDISDYSYAPDDAAALEVPYANQMVSRDSLLYLALQRRNGWKPGGNTIVLVINTITDAVVDTIHFEFQNNNDLILVDHVLYASNPGSDQVQGDGAIEAVDLVTGERSVIITEEELGGNPNAMAHKQGSLFYVQNYVGYKNVGVKEVNFATGRIVTDLDGVKDGYGGIYFDQESSSLFVGDRDTLDMGVKIFRDNARVGSTIRTILPPYGFAVVR